MASDQDIEDITSEIICKLVARNVIGMYDPNHASKAQWRTFLGNQVLLYTRGMGETLGKRRGRELSILDSEPGDGMRDMLMGASWDDYSGLEDAEFLARMRAHVAAAPEWRAGPVSLVDLFDLCVKRLRAGELGLPPRKEVQEQLGVSASAARTGLTLLKGCLRGVLRHAAPPATLTVAGVELTVPQARAAVSALRGSRGNRVAPALAAVASPLADVDTKTFIAVGKAELREHPECKVPKGDRSTHGSQTKTALIHLLERLLYLAAPPQEAPARPVAPDDEPALEEVLEARLWKQKGMTKEDIEEILELARQAFS